MVQAAEMLAVACQHLPVDILGVKQLPGLMVAHRKREQPRPIGNADATYAVAGETAEQFSA